MFIITSLATYIAMVIIVISAIISLIIIGIVYLFNKDAAGAMTQQMTRIYSKTVLFTSGTKIHYKGLENLPKDYPALYICNHRSMFDILLTYSIFPGRTAFVAKESLKKIPLLNVVMIYLNCPFINRTNPREGIKAIFAAIDNVKSGISMFIFPEGTRNKNSDSTNLITFHNGSLKISTRTGCPIIPIALTNAEQIFERHIPILKPTHVVVNIGKPIDPASLEDEQIKKIGKYTQGVIQEMLYENEKILGRS